MKLYFYVEKWPKNGKNRIKLSQIDVTRVLVVVYNPNDQPVVVSSKTVLGLLVPVEVSTFSSAGKDTTKETDKQEILVPKTEVQDMELPEHLNDIYERGIVHLNDIQKLEFKQCLHVYVQGYILKE